MFCYTAGFQIIYLHLVFRSFYKKMEPDVSLFKTETLSRAQQSYLLKKKMSQNDYTDISVKRDHGKATGVALNVRGNITGLAQINIEFYAFTNGQVLQVARQVASKYGFLQQFEQEHAKYWQRQGYRFLAGLFGIFQGKGYLSGKVREQYTINAQSDAASKQLINRICQIKLQKLRTKAQIAIESFYGQPCKSDICFETIILQGTNKQGDVVSMVGLSQTMKQPVKTQLATECASIKNEQ